MAKKTILYKKIAAGSAVGTVKKDLCPKRLWFPGWIECILIILVFSICITGAFLLPAEKCPDEQTRQMISDYIVDTGRLPTGDEPETYIDSWHFSYALFPYLTSMIGAAFAKVFCLIHPGSRVYLLGTRMCSVLSVTGCFWLSILLGRELFSKRGSAILYAVIICFMPQVLFLGMYQNNDALSLLAVSMILYFLVLGHRNHWSVKNCILLAVGISICMLSYYSVYPWILFTVIFCCVSCINDDEIPCKAGFILKRSALIFFVIVLLTGWFFIRNAIVHNGDFLGIATKELMKQKACADGYTLPNFVKRNLGYSFWQFFTEADCYWLRMTSFSAIGVFGNLDILMPQERYGIYISVLLNGIIGYILVRRRKKVEVEGRLLFALMLLSSLSVLALSIYYSFCIDYQPQGRYVISSVLLFSYMLSYSVDKTALSVQGDDTRPISISSIVSFAWIILAFVAAFNTMSKML